MNTFYLSIQPEVGWSEAQVLQVHLGLQESLEPSPALWTTSQLGSLHTSSVRLPVALCCLWWCLSDIINDLVQLQVLALVSASVSRVLRDHLVLRDLVLDH